MNAKFAKLAVGIVASFVVVFGSVGVASAGGPPPSKKGGCMHCHKKTTVTWKKVVTVKWVKVKHVKVVCHHRH